MTPTGKPRAGIYGRQSHGSTKSIDEQVTECTDDVAELGWELAGTYRDTVSASRYARKSRDDWPRLLAAVDAGELDAVVIWESSRGDRTLESWAGFLELCRTRGVLIRVTDDGETYDVRRPKHWKQLATDGVSNAYYSEETRQRNLRTARLTAAAGRPNGPVPFGYERHYHPRTRELLEQVPVAEEAAVVREVFRRVADGEPVKTLADGLNARGAPAPGKWRGGNRWTAHIIRELIRRKSYIGRRTHNGDPDTHSAVWPPIVDESLFWQANRVLSDRAARYWRPSRQQHLLSGIPVCNHCGEVFSGSMDARYGRIYSCRGCGSRINDGDELEELVLAYTLGRLARDDVFATLKRQGEDADAELAAARGEAARLRDELAAWVADAAAGRVTRASFQSIEAGLVARIEQADRRADRAGIPPAVRELIDAGTELPQRWAAMPLAAQRDVVAALVDVTVARGRRGVKIPIRERVRVEWKGTT
jgi:site-specific DNA recombinase